MLVSDVAAVADIAFDDPDLIADAGAWCGVVGFGGTDRSSGSGQRQG